MANQHDTNGVGESANATTHDFQDILDLWNQRAGDSAPLPAAPPEPNDAETQDMDTTHLSPNRHPSGDLFIADIMDAAPKDDQASMEHPIFALKAGDRRVKTYSRNGISVTVKPSYDGCATIFDKDLWVYCISQLMEAKNRGREISRTVQFTMYDFLVTTNRDTSGRAYERATAMLERLTGTRIETNIETDNVRERGYFGLIDSARVIERDNNNRMVAVAVTLPDWLYRSVETGRVLTLSRDYFRLRKPLDRRIYELARKHCGRCQSSFSIELQSLYEKSGSSAPLRKFRYSIKGLSASNELPDYRIVFDEKKDMVNFYPRKRKKPQ